VILITRRLGIALYITRRLGIALYQEKNQFAELGELLASAFGQLHTALELGAANQIAHA
jgi:hypothetical protein